MKYFVTYCAMDGNTGANLLWHSCILLSKENPGLNKLQVIDTWGFYGVPSTENSGGWFNTTLRSLKKKVGLDIDLTGNHGLLRHEETRFLDLGHGLHGITFELTEDQFNTLEKTCKQMILDQEAAIKEFAELHQLKEKPKNETRIYPYEHVSKLIYDTECVVAQQNKRQPRLQPFDMHVWDLTGSHTCKTQAIALLKTVLTKEQIAILTENGQYPTIPRRSGQMEPIFLHSTGPLRERIKRSGDIELYRDAEDVEVKLYWTIPPQVIDTSDPETEKCFLLPMDYIDEVKTVVMQLQRMEWLFRKNTLPNGLEPYKQALFDEIFALYNAFSCIKPKEPYYKITGLKGYALGLFSMPRDPVEKRVLAALEDAQVFLNGLYMATTEYCEIDPENPCVELLASYLSIPAKKQLCELLGRTYCEPLERSSYEPVEKENPVLV